MRILLALILFSSAIVCLASCSGDQPVEESRAQGPSTDSKAGDVPEGIDPERTSDDPTYGYTLDNPIKVGGRLSGPEAQRLYLRLLRDRHFEPFAFERIASVGRGPDGHQVDLYELTASDGERYEVYIDMYHPEIRPLQFKAPQGMYLRP